MRLLRGVSRRWFVALGQPLKILLVASVGGVEGDEGVVREAFNAMGGLACDGIVDDLIHGHSSALKVIFADVFPV